MLATALGMVLGIIIGVVAAYAGGWLDEGIMRLNDVALAFPQILLALLVLDRGDQPRPGGSSSSSASRTPRAWPGWPAAWPSASSPATSSRGRGARREALRVIMAEVLPNMNAPLLAEAGLRLTYSIGLVAGLGFLGFATDPGAADWGLMINENRLALPAQPWGVLAPVLIIGLFTVGTNLMADGIAQLTARGGD